VKLAWYGRARKVAAVPRSVFWPVPNVDSALVSFERGELLSTVDRQKLFAVVDAAFSQRRKTLRAALASWAGSAERAGELLAAADIDPKTRGEQLDVRDFARIAAAAG
jgi:16S rRNA (adenine1518-N6/adenine1519-N6)-dimethyltransferase